MHVTSSIFLGFPSAFFLFTHTFPTFVRLLLRWCRPICCYRKSSWSRPPQSTEVKAATLNKSSSWRKSTVEPFPVQWFFFNWPSCCLCLCGCFAVIWSFRLHIVRSEMSNTWRSMSGYGCIIHTLPVQQQNLLHCNLLESCLFLYSVVSSYYIMIQQDSGNRLNGCNGTGLFTYLLVCVCVRVRVCVFKRAPN